MHEKTDIDLYEEYVKRYNGYPKHDSAHFVTVINSVIFHREINRPRIIWWEDVRKNGYDK